MAVKKLRIVFMGTPEFAVQSLYKLDESIHEIVGVVTAPDRPQGRGRQLKGSAVKEYALNKGIEIFQPTNLKDESFINGLKSLKADLYVVVAFRMLPRVIWEQPKFGTINLHASLLPNYRGAAPINWAIINGEKITGVTTFFIDDKIDTGKIIMQTSTVIGKKETAGSLHDKLMLLGADLLLKTVDLISMEGVETFDQSHYDKMDLNEAPKLYKEDCKVNWHEGAESIVNKIRGLSPYPAAWSTLINKEKEEELSFKILSAEESSSKVDSNVSDILSDGENYIKVCCGDGKMIELLKIQIAGKKAMGIPELLRGFTINSFQIKES